MFAQYKGFRGYAWTIVTLVTVLGVALQVIDRTSQSLRARDLMPIQVGGGLARAEPAQALLAGLANGTYQFCTEPDPQDGRDGAGICLQFKKSGDRVDGYYGYPHSGDFICVRGNADGDLIRGKALAVSWPGHPLSSVIQSEFQWDPAGHLTLSQGHIVRSIKDEVGQTDWIQFDSALLDAKGFYRYSESRMSPASQLCEWGGTSDRSRFCDIFCRTLKSSVQSRLHVALSSR